jgi:hypothetical protein
VHRGVWPPSFFEHSSIELAKLLILQNKVLDFHLWLCYNMEYNGRSHHAIIDQQEAISAHRNLGGEHVDGNPMLRMRHQTPCAQAL